MRQVHTLIENAVVISQPTLFPSRDPFKHKLLFDIRAEDKVRTCIVWGSTATLLCHHLNKGAIIDAEGILTPTYLFVAEVIRITSATTFTVTHPKPGNIWTRWLAKLRCPGNCVSRPY